MNQTTARMIFVLLKFCCWQYLSNQEDILSSTEMVAHIVEMLLLRWSDCLFHSKSSTPDGQSE